MIAIVFLTAQNSLTKSSGAPFGNTGSIGDGASNTCGKMGCHATSVNTGPGALTIDLSNIPSTGWAPGKTYNIGVTVADAGRGTFGFQLTVENTTGGKKGTLTGTNKVTVANTNWATHKGTSATGNWTFDWTAPTDNSQQLIFNMAGIGANSNGNQTGDNVYTTSKSVDRDLIAGINDLDDQSAYVILNNPAESILSLEAPTGSEMILFNMNGQREMNIVFSSDHMDVSVDHLKRGMYILTNDRATFSRRVLLK